MEADFFKKLLAQVKLEKNQCYLLGTDFSHTPKTSEWGC